MTFPAGYRCVECSSVGRGWGADGHARECGQPARDRAADRQAWNNALADLIPAGGQSDRYKYKRVAIDDGWNGHRPIDPMPNPLSLANHAELNRVLRERVEAEEAWLGAILASLGLPLDAATAARCLLETNTDHPPGTMRYHSVLKLDGAIVGPPFVWTMTYVIEAP